MQMASIKQVCNIHEFNLQLQMNPVAHIPLLTLHETVRGDPGSQSRVETALNFVGINAYLYHNHDVKQQNAAVSPILTSWWENHGLDLSVQRLALNFVAFFSGVGTRQRSQNLRTMGTSAATK